MDHLEKARTELNRARNEAGGVMQSQLDSIEEGIFEEIGGEKTQDEPGPKADRIAELADKLDGLEEEVESYETRQRIATARDHLRAYLTNGPSGR